MQLGQQKHHNSHNTDPGRRKIYRERESEGGGRENERENEGERDIEDDITIFSPASYKM